MKLSLTTREQFAKSTREAKNNTWTISKNKPGVRVGVNNFADLNERKETGVNNFKLLQIFTKKKVNASRSYALIFYLPMNTLQKCWVLRDKYTWAFSSAREHFELKFHPWKFFFCPWTFLQKSIRELKFSTWAFSKTKFYGFLFVWREKTLKIMGT